jgi:hypothetical protein
VSRPSPESACCVGLGVVVDLRERQLLAQPVTLAFVAGGVNALREQKRLVEPVTQVA